MSRAIGVSANASDLPDWTAEAAAELGERLQAGEVDWLRRELVIANAMYVSLYGDFMELYELYRRAQAKADDRWKSANLARRARRLGKVHRAIELRRSGMSAPEIGIRMANEHGRPDRPYSERQVRRWWAEAKKGCRVDVMS